MSASHFKARISFQIAVIMLLFSASAASWFIARFISSEKSLQHTYAVGLKVGELDAAVASAGRTRMALVQLGDDKDLQHFYALRQEIQTLLGEVRALTGDQPLDQRLYKQLESLIHQRMTLYEQSINAQQQGQSGGDAALNTQAAKLAFDAVEVREQIKRNEDGLLAQRTTISAKLAVRILVILLTIVGFSIVLLWIHHRLLDQELRNREAAELAAQRLSRRLLEVRDEERRTISRELHAALGQNLAFVKFLGETVLRKYPRDQQQQQLLRVLEECVREMHTLSHLLHPPLLDEIGLGAAARSFIEGFAERTGVQMITDIADIVPRLSPKVELVLFRAIQEALTNLHRHSGSSSGEVSLHCQNGRVTLAIRDYGKGMPVELLQQFLSTGSGVGIGLVGMRERVQEQGGLLDILSNTNGTIITITIPLVNPVSAIAARQNPSRIASIFRNLSPSARISRPRRAS